MVIIDWHRVACIAYTITCHIINENS